MELLVTITIIGIMASIAWGAVAMARNSAREYATKATIAKLHSILMKQYDSFATRRLPQSGGQNRATVLATLINEEMPTTKAGYDSAQCLYWIVSRYSPEALEQFNQSEIGGMTGGKPFFIDGWKASIKYSRSTTDQLPIISSDHNISNQIIEQR